MANSPDALSNPGRDRDNRAKNINPRAQYHNENHRRPFSRWQVKSPSWLPVPPAFRAPVGCEPDRAVAKKCFIVIAFNYINNVVALLGVVRKNFKGILAQKQVEPVNLLATN